MFVCLGGLGRLLTCVVLLAVSAPAAVAYQGTAVLDDAPVPIAFPRDDGPHDSTIEWWYFTGHVFTQDGDRYGFEYVTFRARNGNLEGYVSHFAVTDNPNGRFAYNQRIQGSAGVAGDGAALDLDLDGWTMHGGNGEFALGAAMPGYDLRLDVETTKPAALHDLPVARYKITGVMVAPGGAKTPLLGRRAEHREGRNRAVQTQRRTSGL